MPCIFPTRDLDNQTPMHLRTCSQAFLHCRLACCNVTRLQGTRHVAPHFDSSRSRGCAGDRGYAGHRQGFPAEGSGRRSVRNYRQTQRHLRSHLIASARDQFDLRDSGVLKDLSAETDRHGSPRWAPMAVRSPASRWLPPCANSSHARVFKVGSRFRQRRTPVPN